MEPQMDANEFRKCGTELVNMVADYLENIRDRSVLPDVRPGYITDLLPDSPPEQPHHWKDVLNDIEKVVMPGMTHWNHPNFHAYFPTANSYPAMCADILGSALTCIGFTWMSSPACTEMEMVMMDWLAKALKLPEHFLFESKGVGGGIIQGTASEATLVALLGARSRILNQFKDTSLDKLVAYASDQSHSSVERAALLGAVRIRLLPADENLSLRSETLQKAIKEDKEKGLIPFMVIATLGTTNSCAFDNIKELGPVCQEQNIWLHIDAAYAGSAFICPEYRHFLDGVEFADSYNFNPHKWMLVNFDCSAMWVKNRYEITEAFSVNPTYLKHEMEGQIPDYRHWQIPLGRRFRSLKLWFVFRMIGVEGLRKHIREQIRMAKEFETMVASDSKWTIEAPVDLGLVCFRLKDSNSENEKILKRINERRKIHITPTTIRGRYMLRFAVCSRFTTSEDVKFAWSEIQTVASQLKSN
ncbi:aromatic-L-amino-acid decarboxylase [Parasteatoda tepidariorum]|uniref:aromatic-L-amino-acid decarboxylase n=1 Tax=Parasteatoda tepidariorum TaxID=114398 RepID=UPI00077FC827|nr:aromatic-L-amino-acid decarboxylase [Parasteatoda tepidariorum]XP_015922983.1 aromatic-L-amino-acid decarboxylase [Parasteatoda tepidariorum]XP_015922984.1 aromatic-L-amino-acid decarboxylase [Parasteatoda tepidariorum]XP_015922985.1 aromatic-L-amino-acid decarboxylase [Parasteatoda tepidariorum]XP_042899311.1 aromatic-L-amino-acid decarboxylase [Parasteatoda tepidariorum]XP_042899313.1 aromatic-L-amino-acid decarboxylase [Parasteatoda tepidariorum]